MLQRWEPFRELRRVEEEMDRLWHGLARRGPWFGLMGSEGLFVPLDVYQTKDQVVVKASLPGVKPEEVEISTSGNTLTIKGETKEEKEIKEADYLLSEHRYGSFRRTVTLPEGVDTDKAEASFAEGVLTINIPKKDEVKPKTLKIQVAKTVQG
jgi:HSP20 family protein